MHLLTQRILGIAILFLLGMLEKTTKCPGPGIYCAGLLAAFSGDLERLV